MTEQCIVDNRVFLLGLDALYRSAMKEHERTELLNCARQVAKTLQVAPANVPIEGYYTEDERLTEYFRLLRALQVEPKCRIPEVAHLEEFQRLDKITAAPLYGWANDQGRLLKVGRDALTQALSDTNPGWTLERLSTRAAEVARERDEFSLVGLAARIGDPVLLAATRESSVAYAEGFLGGIPPQRTYVWQVDRELAEFASRFIGVFLDLFDEDLPPPTPAQAECYWVAFKSNVVLGRCVRIAYDDRCLPPRHYRWGIYCNSTGKLAVQEFWSSYHWTTAAYRRVIGPEGNCPKFRDQGGADEASGNR